MPVKTKNKVLADLLRYESNPLYTRESAPIRNASGATVTLTNPLGTPLKLVGGVWTIAVIADVAIIDGFLLETDDLDPIAATTTTVKQFNILKRGEAILDIAGLPALDPVGATWVKATIATGALTRNVPPILIRNEPTLISTQDS